MYDLNDAGEQMVMGDLIPDGTFARVRLAIKPGGRTIPNAPAIDQGLFTASKSSDAIMLATEITIVAGRHAKRKLWQHYVITGGSKDDKGVSKGWSISKAAIRAMVDSRLGLRQSDMSEEARRKRLLEGLKQIDGIEFAAKISIEPPSDPKYQDQNRIGRVLVPGDPQYEAVMAGQDVAPEPSGRKARPAAASGPSGSDVPPAWANGNAATAQGGAQFHGADPQPPKAAGGPAWMTPGN